MIYMAEVQMSLVKLKRDKAGKPTDIVIPRSEKDLGIIEVYKQRSLEHIRARVEQDFLEKYKNSSMRIDINGNIKIESIRESKELIPVLVTLTVYVTEVREINLKKEPLFNDIDR